MDLTDALDGNAIGGLLQEIFDIEMTTAVGICAHCGAAAQLAEGVVYLRAPGTLLRCRSCGAVLLAVVRHHELNCVDLQGLSALEPR
jgi:Family of unknown function (DUF6510)